MIRYTYFPYKIESSFALISMKSTSQSAFCFFGTWIKLKGCNQIQSINCLRWDVIQNPIPVFKREKKIISNRIQNEWQSIFSNKSKTKYRILRPIVNHLFDLLNNELVSLHWRYFNNKTRTTKTKLKGFQFTNY